MVTNLQDEATSSSGTKPSPLYASVRGEGPPVVLLHGLFGMGSNLGALARSLADRYQVHQLDLPNHGRSDWSDTSSLQSMAADVSAYIEEVIAAPAFVAGHSLGGKVCMQLAMSYADRVRALLIADIAPLIYSPSHAAVFKAIGAVAAEPPESRAAAIERMSDFVTEPGVRQFLALSLYRDESGRYRWRFNADGLRAAYPELLKPPVGEAFFGPAHLIYGALSSYVGEAGEAAARRYFPAIEFTMLEDTGHWLHAEKPDEFNAAVGAFFDGVSGVRV